ncbi:hypothetical protein ACFC5X_15725 [Streptomyces sp. NPDC055952]|uniref:hypothetical protein n=1 Tax=Streptomyces sp. NPDC055952 TaxID=3345663 RepID=UPI0035E23458
MGSSDEHVCPTCGQPVETVVRRHKTLGTWVPRWVAGPCRNPDCAAREAGDADTAAVPVLPAPEPHPAGSPTATTTAPPGAAPHGSGSSGNTPPPTTSP